MNKKCFKGVNISENFYFMENFKFRPKVGHNFLNSFMPLMIVYVFLGFRPKFFLSWNAYLLRLD